MRLSNINTNYRLHWVLRFCFHIAALGGGFHYGLSWQGTLVLVVAYIVSMLSITVGYHRYFSHKAFQTSRSLQFLMGFVGCCQLQGGPIAWSAVHRHHHRYSDEEDDLHSPLHGFYRAHMGWLLKPKTYEIAFSPLRDLQRYQELVWLDRYNYLPALFSFVVLWGLGETYNSWVPGSIVDGTFVLFWGGVLRVVLVWHATWSVNSICHLWGTRPFHTKDQSRNNSLIALITMGEGWHNNHHYDPSAVRSGRTRMQIDMSYLLIRTLEYFGLVTALRPLKTPES